MRIPRDPYVENIIFKTYLAAVLLYQKISPHIYGIIRLILSRYKDCCQRKDGVYSSTRVRLDAISESPGSSSGCPSQVFH